MKGNVFFCDICGAQTKEEELPWGWSEITVKSIVNFDDPLNVYHVCKPECYKKLLNNLMEERNPYAWCLL